MSNLFEIIPNQRTVDIMRLDGIQWSFQENVTYDDIKSDKKKETTTKLDTLQTAYFLNS